MWYCPSLIALFPVGTLDIDLDLVFPLYPILALLLLFSKQLNHSVWRSSRTKNVTITTVDFFFFLRQLLPQFKTADVNCPTPKPLRTAFDNMKNSTTSVMAINPKVFPLGCFGVVYVTFRFTFRLIILKHAKTQLVPHHFINISLPFSRNTPNCK